MSAGHNWSVEAYGALDTQKAIPKMIHKVQFNKLTSENFPQRL